MDIRKIKKLIELLHNSDVAEIEISEGEESVRITRGVVNQVTTHLPQNKYEQTNDELFYEIYKFDNLFTLLAWTTLGYFKYKKFNKKEELVNFFQEEFNLIINKENIN